MARKSSKSRSKSEFFVPFHDNFVDGSTSWTAGNTTWTRMCGNATDLIGASKNTISDSGYSVKVRKAKYLITFRYKSAYTFSAQLGLVECLGDLSEQLNTTDNIRANLETGIAGPFEFKMKGKIKQAKLESYDFTNNVGIWICTFEIDMTNELNQFLKKSSSINDDTHNLVLFWNLVRDNTTATDLYFSISSYIETVAVPNSVQEFSLIKN